MGERNPPLTRAQTITAMRSSWTVYIIKPISKINTFNIIYNYFTNFHFIHISLNHYPYKIKIQHIHTKSKQKISFIGRKNQNYKSYKPYPSKCGVQCSLHTLVDTFGTLIGQKSTNQKPPVIDKTRWRNRGEKPFTSQLICRILSITGGLSMNHTDITILTKYGVIPVHVHCLSCAMEGRIRLDWLSRWVTALSYGLIYLSSSSHQ